MDSCGLQATMDYCASMDTGRSGSSHLTLKIRNCWGQQEQRPCLLQVIRPFGSEQKWELFNLSLKDWKIRRPQEFRNHVVRALLYQNDSTVWLGTTEGLYKYNPISDKSVLYNHINSGLSQNIVLALYLDRSGNLWVGTEDKLNILRAGQEVFETFDLKGSYKPNIKHNLVLDIQAYSDGNDSIAFY